MKFSYNWLKELVNFKHAPEKLAELLNLRAFEVESAGKMGDDFVLEIKLPSNRVPDAAGHIGMAGEIGALLNIRIKNQESRIRENKKRNIKDALFIQIDDKEKCQRYCARIMEGVKVAESPAWLKERLTVCGLRPINALIDATNYIMLETGQPLHVFDYDKIQGGKIIIRNARNGECITTLDGQKLELSADDLVIADSACPLALAGIKGGTAAEIDMQTRAIVLESANFSGSAVRKTSIRTEIRTDASYRFEHSLPPELAAYALERLVALIQKIAGGVCLKGVLDVYPKKEKTPMILFRPAYADALLGVSLRPMLYKLFLSRSGCRVSGTQRVFKVTPPVLRKDLQIEEDLIEETARLYGYENIPETLPQNTILASHNNAVAWTRFIRRELVGMGASEIYRYALTGERDMTKNMLRREGHVELENPLSSDMRFLTREPYENFLRFFSAEDACSELFVFSVDTGFSENSGNGKAGTPIHEERYLTIAYARDNKKRDDERESFYRLKGAVSGLFDSCGIDDYWFDDEFSDNPSYARLQLLQRLHPLRRAEIKIGSDTLGVIGEVHPTVIENWKIERRTAIAEIFMDKLLKYARSEIEFNEIPRFPAIERALAVLVNEFDRIETVQGIIENAIGDILEDVDFFDEYTGEGIPDGRRSLAFKLIFRNKNRTLKDSEVNTAMDKIASALKEKNWEVR